VAAIVSTDPFDASVFAVATRLRVIARVGVGTDSIDLRAATDAGVIVTTTPGLNRETTADHTLAMMLAALRRLLEHDNSIRRNTWARGGRLMPWDLHGLTVGLVGYGSIGQAVARRLRGFGVDLLVADPAIEGDDQGVEMVELPELLERAHVISLHTPLVDETRGLIGAQELARMRPDAILVNTARGGLVDEKSLTRALAAGKLRAAALDVFQDEPELSPELRRLTNVVLTPHIGGLSERSVAEMTRQAARNVIDVLYGCPSPEVVANPAALVSTTARVDSPAGAIQRELH
jgi:phosphoglycerate dehydrogenase-like enzyme